MSRLSRNTLGQVPAGIHVPRRRVAPGVGVVHFGPGAFHRAHQASYIDTVLDHDPRWSIAAVSLRSRGTVATLAEQDGLYTLAIRDAEPSWRVIDAHRAFLGPDDAARTATLLADPAVRLVTTTVTEKGYCLRADGTLDLDHEDIAADLAGSGAPTSVIGWLVGGLAARRAARVAPFVPLPCDNLADNGAKLHAALVAFARVRDPELAAWITGEVRIPSTMVDSITPASDEPFYGDVAAALGLDDRAAVQREAFSQWVIEDCGVPLGPDLAGAGAILTANVSGYEQAKLRILNGAHSTLAYIGLLRGHASVAAAMADAPLAAFVDAMISRDIIPMLAPVAGLDLATYRATVLQRFRNPAILHRLEQIAQDGSQKLPYRLGDTLAANRHAGRMPGHVVAALGSWVAFVITRIRTGLAVIDPAASMLTAAAADGTPATVIRWLAERRIALPAALLDDAPLLAAIDQAANAALDNDWDKLLSACQ